MFHLHMRYIAKSNGASSSSVMDYIARTGRYAGRGDRVRELIALNLPSWAVANHGAAYWAAADSTRSRANARQAYVLDFALPNELTTEMQRELAVQYAMEVSSLCEDGLSAHGSVPLLLGIHEGHGTNPHCHLMLSSSINDGIRRAPGAWFMRHNPKHLELGGAKRSRAMAKTAWLIRVRELWAAMANKALVAAGFTGSLDHRSNLSRGISSEPSIHLGPSAAHLLRQNRPAPRVEKYSRVQLRNAEQEALRDSLESCRRRLRDLEVEEIDAERAREAWLIGDQRRWSQIFTDHALSSDTPARVQLATAFVVETDRANQQVVYSASLGGALAKLVEDAVGSEWGTVTTPAGLWLVRPMTEKVVFVGSGYAATDGEDVQSIDALIVAARLLPYKSASVRAKGSILDRATSRLRELQVNWSVLPIRGTAVRPFLGL